MENSSFQERLGKINKGFDKLIHQVTLPKDGRQEIVLTYKGDEIFDGVYTSFNDVIVSKVEEIEGGIKIYVRIKAIIADKQNRSVVVYFDPGVPFYKKDGDIIIPNDRKLKQTINISITGVQDFDTYEYNFGEVVEGDKIDFQFFYTGQDTISGIKGGCGCTDVNLDGSKIFGVLDTKGLNGNVAKTINVYFGEYNRQYEVSSGVLIPNKNSRLTTLTIRGFTIPK